MSAMQVEVIPIGAAELAAWEPAWRAVEREAPDAPPFVCFDWLAAWVEVYAREQQLAVVRSGTDAIGLIERRPGGRWRFAGRPIGSARGLLCRDGAQHESWEAFGAWLRAHGRRWTTLDAEGVAEHHAAAALPGARETPVEVPVLALPDSLEAYFAGRSRSTRATLRHIRNRAARVAEAREVPADKVPVALEGLVELHTRRAASRAERHPAVDARLVQALLRMGAAASTCMVLFELLYEGRRVGVVMRLDRGTTSWFYNQGIDPDALKLAPGIALQLLMIEDAIARGQRRLELGPGAHPYKLDLGGVVELRADVRAVSPSLRGRMLAGVESSGSELRRRLPLRRLARRARNRLARRS